MHTSVDITIPYIHIEKMLGAHGVDKNFINQHLNINDPEVTLFKEKNKPKVKVNFYRLDPEMPTDEIEDIVSVPVDEDSRIDMVINTQNNQPRSFKLKQIHSAYLWDLSSFEKVDLLRSGRFKKNDFIPIIQENPLKMDLGVSREHSLICYYNSQMFYIDYGTSIKFDPEELENAKNGNGKTISHFGSKNGSWIYQNYNIQDCIKNSCVKWSSDYYIGIGTFFYKVKLNEQNLKLYHQFSFNYEILE